MYLVGVDGFLRLLVLVSLPIDVATDLALQILKEEYGFITCRPISRDCSCDNSRIRLEPEQPQRVKETLTVLITDDTNFQNILC